MQTLLALLDVTRPDTQPPSDATAGPVALALVAAAFLVWLAWYLPAARSARRP